jgi:F0F1-type ATP synthase assembly protein I
MSKKAIIVAGIVIGAVIGYIYYFYVVCASGILQ